MKFLSAGFSGGFEVDVVRKSILINIFASIGVLSLLAFGILSFNENRLIFASILFLFMTVTLFAILFLQIFKKVNIAGHIIVILLYSLCIFLLIHGGVDKTGYLWFYSFPVVSLFVFGKKTGGIYLLTLLTIVLILFIVQPYFAVEYTTSFKIRFLITFSITNFLTFIYEFIREKTYKSLLDLHNEKIFYANQAIEQSEKLKIQSQQLEEINKELVKLSIIASETENAVVIFDKNGKPEWVNKGFEKMYGFGLDEFIKRKGATLYEMGNVAEVSENIKECFVNKKPVQYSCKLYNSNDEAIWVRTTLTPILSENGDLEKVIAIDTDITNIKEIEESNIKQKEELKTQQKLLLEANKELEKLSIIASETNNAVVIFDKKGKPEWVNYGFKKLYGFNLEEFIAKRGNNLFEMENTVEVLNSIRECYTKVIPVQYNCELHKNTGEPIWIQTSLTPILDEKGDLYKVIAIDADISQLKEAEMAINQQKEELQAQGELLTNVNRKLEKTNHILTDSINYAKRIQDAMMPSEEIIKQQFADSFLFFKPKHIVSGDFLWFSKQENLIYFAVADCTGHGVSGAFMSMMGNTLLNEIVNEKKISSPDEILNQLNSGVIYALSRGVVDKDVVQPDGMDISLIRIDTETNEAEISLANQQVIIVQNKKIIEIEPSIFSIGGDFQNRIDKKFTNHKIKLQKGDSVYMLSDGYQDQFGGDENKKYSISKLEKFILEIHENKMIEQKQLFENENNNWRNSLKQTDDILVFGFKI